MYEQLNLPDNLQALFRNLVNFFENDEADGQATKDYESLIEKHAKKQRIDVLLALRDAIMRRYDDAVFAMDLHNVWNEEAEKDGDSTALGELRLAAFSLLTKQLVWRYELIETYINDFIIYGNYREGYRATRPSFVLTSGQMANTAVFMLLQRKYEFESYEAFYTYWDQEVRSNSYDWDIVNDLGVRTGKQGEAVTRSIKGALQTADISYEKGSYPSFVRATSLLEHQAKFNASLKRDWLNSR